MQQNEFYSGNMAALFRFSVCEQTLGPKLSATVNVMKVDADAAWEAAVKILPKCVGSLRPGATAELEQLLADNALMIHVSLEAKVAPQRQDAEHALDKFEAIEASLTATAAKHPASGSESAVQRLAGA